MPNHSIRQIGALPFWVEPGGGVDLCLVTNRGGARWFIPKGNPIPGLSAHQVAQREALEEAGIIGTIGAASIGAFEFTRRREGRTETCIVDVYPLRVRARLTSWAESRERTTLRCSVEKAASLIQLPGLVALIQDYFVEGETRRLAFM